MIQGCIKLFSKYDLAVLSTFSLTTFCTPRGGNFTCQECHYNNLISCETIESLCRIVNEGVPCVEVTESDGKDCVGHLPPQTSDSLADWQRIAEYYVEKPRMMLHGQAVRRISTMFIQLFPPNILSRKCFTIQQDDPLGGTKHIFNSLETGGF